MVLIDQDTMAITISRGDFSSLRFSFCREGEPHRLGPGDAARFTVKKRAKDRAPLFTATVANPGEAFVDIVMEEGDFEALPFGSYVYDLRLRFADGRLWTPPDFPAPFTVKEVVGNG